MVSDPLTPVVMHRGQSLIIPPLFYDTNYTYWKVRVRVFLQSLDEKLLHLCAKGFMTKELLNLHCWMNWRTLQPTSSSSWCVSLVLGSAYHWSVTYWESCIEWRDCCYITSPIGYWGKGSIIGWYLVLGFLLLVIACFDNSGFLGVVTLNSPNGVLPQ